MELDKQSIKVIQKALAMVPFGKVTFIMQNQCIMKVLTESQIYVSVPTPEGLDISVPIKDIMRRDSQG